MNYLTFNGVYLLYNNGIVVYVGQSANCINRINWHKFNKDFNRFEIIETKDKIEMEKELIQIFNPKYNTHYRLEYNNISRYIT